MVSQLTVPRSQTSNIKEREGQVGPCSPGEHPFCLQEWLDAVSLQLVPHTGSGDAPCAATSPADFSMLTTPSVFEK